MRFNLRCGLPAPASLAGWLNSDVERLLSYVQFSKAKDSNRCRAVARHAKTASGCLRAIEVERVDGSFRPGPEADRSERATEIPPFALATYACG